MEFILRHISDFGPAVLLTLEIFALALGIAAFWGLALAVIKTWGRSPLRLLAGAYVEVYRNTPLLTQLYFIFFGLPFLGIKLAPLVAATMAISLQHGAFFCEIYRGAIRGISPSQYDAGRALALSQGQVFRHIVLPQAARDALPPAGSQVVLVLQDTAVASTVGVLELTLTGYGLGARFGAGFEVFVLVGAIYLVLQTVVGVVLRVVEGRVRVSR